MNENTENSRIEVEKVQTENDDENKKSYSQKRKSCDEKSTGNLKKKQTTDLMNRHIQKIWTRPFAAMADTRNKPSCSGISGRSNTQQDDAKRQYRKRKKGTEVNSSDSDDEVMHKNFRLAKVVVLGRHRKRSTTDTNNLPKFRLVVDENTGASFSGSHERMENVNDNSSNSKVAGTSKNASELDDDPRPSSSRSHDKNEEQTDRPSSSHPQLNSLAPLFELLQNSGIAVRSNVRGEGFVDERRVTPPPADEIAVIDEHEFAEEGVRGRDRVEIHRNTSGNPYRVFRFNRTFGDPEDNR